MEIKITTEDKLRDEVNKQLQEINSLREVIAQNEKVYILRNTNQQTVIDALRKTKQIDNDKNNIIISWLEGRAFDNDR